MTIDKIRLITKTLLQDSAEVLSSVQIKEFIVKALSFHSKNVPRYVVAEITGDGGYEYSLPATFYNGFSMIKTIEFPSGERVPVYLKDTDWIVYENVSGKEIRFLYDSPSASQTFLLTFSVPFLESTINEIPDNDATPFCYLAASLCSKALSMYYSQTSNPTINVDSINRKSKGKEYETRADMLYEQYATFFGITKKGSGGSVFLNWDTNTSQDDRYSPHAGW